MLGKSTHQIISRSAFLLSGAALVAMTGSTFVSLFGTDILRNFVDGLSHTGPVTVLDRISDVHLVASLRALAIMAAGTAALLWALRRRLIDLLARSPTAPPEVGYAWITSVELVVVSGVIATGVVLAVQNLSLPMRGDEALTSVRFATRALWSAWSDYPYPNNHVLHSLLAWTAWHIGGWNPVALRMPAFLAACFTLPILWWFVRQEQGWLAATLATALLATSPLFIEYATSARGYTLMLLFFLLSLLCGRALVRRPDVNELWMAYALITALGFLTIPLMAFPAAITGAWMVILRYRVGGLAGLLPFAGKMVGGFGLAMTITLLLYTPVLMESGFDALFSNKDVRSLSFRDGNLISRFIGHFIVIWLQWHEATPLWAQTVLLVLIVIGAVAPQRSRGHCSAFAVAVVIGTAGVLLVKPVILPLRMTIFLLLAAMIMAGTGAAVLIEGVLSRLRWNVLVLHSVRTGMILLALGGFTWWATRPGVAERFAQETGFSPTAKSLVAGVLHDMRPGDYVLGLPEINSVRFYLAAAGYDSIRSHAGPFLLFHKKIKTYQINNVRPNASGRIFLFVDEAAYKARFTPRGRPATPRVIDYRAVRRYLEESGYDYQIVVSLPDGKVYRFVHQYPDLASVHRGGPARISEAE